MGFDQVEMPEDSVLRTDVDKFGWEGQTAKVPVLVLTTIFFYLDTFSRVSGLVHHTLLDTVQKRKCLWVNFLHPWISKFLPHDPRHGYFLIIHPSRNRNHLNIWLVKL
jgi:hypothetical protein